MRKIAAGLLLSSLLLAGCSSSKKSGPSLCDEHCQSNMAAADGSTLASVVPGVTIDDVSFLSTTQKDWPQSTAKQVIQLGHDMCQQFKAGLTWAEIAKADIAAGATGAQVGGLTAAATTFYCPQYKSLTPAG